MSFTCIEFGDRLLKLNVIEVLVSNELKKSRIRLYQQKIWLTGKQQDTESYSCRDRAAAWGSIENQT